MTDKLVQLGEDFWSVRGSFRLGPIDIGTQCALVRLGDGDYVFLDSYRLDDALRAEIDRLLGENGRVRAILNLHPFHTVHCKWMHCAFPQAELYGTARHIEKFPALPWQATKCEDSALADIFGADLAFSVPRGVPLVCDDENVHFSSVLAYHRKSGTIHVDDTFNYLRKGFPLSLLPITGRLDFHMTLGKALEQRPGAADDFRQWAIDLGIAWSEARRIATAHNAVFEFGEGAFPELVGEALGRAKPVLDKHRAKFG